MGYFVIGLKTGKFRPEYADKLNFGIALVNDRLRREAHADTVGIPICRSKTTTPSAARDLTHGHRLQAEPADRILRRDTPLRAPAGA